MVDTQVSLLTVEVKSSDIRANDQKSTRGWVDLLWQNPRLCTAFPPPAA